MLPNLRHVIYFLEAIITDLNWTVVFLEVAWNAAEKLAELKVLGKMHGIVPCSAYS